jgi:U4/U6.U5 tri-snRNP component SNU23
MDSSSQKDSNKDVDLSEYELIFYRFYKEDMERKKKQNEAPKNIPKKTQMDLKAKLKIGKVNIVNPKNLKNEFYCSICDVLKHDSSGYQSHLNGKAHMKNIGKDLTVEKSTLAQVRSRLNGTKMETSNNSYTPSYCLQKTQRFKKVRKSKIEEEEPMTTEQSEIYQAMGFKNFGNKAQQ